MDYEVLHSFSRKLGITAGDVVSKAAELERFLDVRGCSLSLNGTAKSVICLEIAANGSRIPVDRNMAISLSAMTKKAYIHAYKTLECVLGKQKDYTIQELAVQFGCLEASCLAQQVHQRYSEEFVHNMEDISHPVFVATALYTACKHKKIKIDKTKLLTLTGAKRSTFDNLHKKMAKIISTLESADSQEKTSKRVYGLLDKVDEIIKDGADQSLKQQKVEEGDNSVEDREYEEWKRQILESAAKAMSKEKET